MQTANKVITGLLSAEELSVFQQGPPLDSSVLLRLEADVLLHVQAVAREEGADVDYLRTEAHSEVRLYYFMEVSARQSITVQVAALEAALVVASLQSF